MKTLTLAILILAQDPEKTVQKTLAEVVQQAAKESGAQFLVSGDVPLGQKTVTFPADYLAGKEAFARCLKLLREGGFAAVRSEDAWRVVTGTLALKQDLPEYEKIEDLPKTDEFCRLTIQLKNLSPRDAHATLINMVSYPQGIFPIESSRSLVISDYAPVLRRLGELVVRLDARTERAARGEFLVTFTLIKGVGEGGAETAEVPKALAGFAEILKSQARYARYEVLDIGSARVNLDAPGRMTARVALAGEEGYEVEFVPIAAGAGVRFESVRLLQVKDRRFPDEALSTTLTLREDERALVGSCRPMKASWPLVLVVELKAVK